MCSEDEHVVLNQIALVIKHERELIISINETEVMNNSVLPFVVKNSLCQVSNPKRTNAELKY